MKKSVTKMFAFCLLAALFLGGGVVRGNAEIYLCTPTSFTAIYDSSSETVNCSGSYKGVIQPDRTYTLMMADSGGTMVSVHNFKGNEFDIGNGAFLYSFILLQSAYDKYAKPFRITLKCGAPNVLKPISAEVDSAQHKFVLGDVNADRKVGNLDAAKILQYDAGLKRVIDLKAADVTGDGTVDNMDAAAILKYDAGLILGFGK